MSDRLTATFDLRAAHVRGEHLPPTRNVDRLAQERGGENLCESDSNCGGSIASWNASLAFTRRMNLALNLRNSIEWPL
jgi:hypothetical protein